MSKLRKYSLLLIACLISSCTVEARLSEYPGLKERVADYYVAEQKNDWSLAYTMRTPDFRKMVSEKTYVASMLKDNAGWSLKTYQPESCVN